MIHEQLGQVHLVSKYPIKQVQLGNLTVQEDVVPQADGYQESILLFQTGNRSILIQARDVSETVLESLAASIY